MQETYYAVPVATDERINLTNGFTIGKKYHIVWNNGRVGEVKNDNGHSRIVALDGSLCAHLMYRNSTGDTLAGYFKIVAERGGHVPESGAKKDS